MAQGICHVVELAWLLLIDISDALQIIGHNAHRSQCTSFILKIPSTVSHSSRYSKDSSHAANCNLSPVSCETKMRNSSDKALTIDCRETASHTPTLLHAPTCSPTASNLCRPGVAGSSRRVCALHISYGNCALRLRL